MEGLVESVEVPEEIHILANEPFMTEQHTIAMQLMDLNSIRRPMMRVDKFKAVE